MSRPDDYDCRFMMSHVCLRDTIFIYATVDSFDATIMRDVLYFDAYIFDSAFVGFRFKMPFSWRYQLRERYQPAISL